MDTSAGLSKISWISNSDLSNFVHFHSTGTGTESSRLMSCLATIIFKAYSTSINASPFFEIISSLKEIVALPVGEILSSFAVSSLT